jgi:hypothetical protein
VDAFLLLSTENGKDEKKDEKELLRVQLVETAHGLCLLHSFEEVDTAKLEETVERIIQKLTGIVPKIIQPLGKAIPVGIVDVHRVQLGERYPRLAGRPLGILSRYDERLWTDRCLMSPP